MSLSERSRELASLRVLGFTRAEISLILLGELALLTLAALPVGGAVRLRSFGAHRQLHRQRGLPVSARTCRAQAVASSFLGIIGAAVVSGLMVRRRLDRLDLVAVLKIRE